MVKENIFRELKFYLTILFIFVFLIGFSSAALNLTISGTHSNSTETFDADFRVVDKVGAVTGLEGYDYLSPTLSNGYASFSSVLPVGQLNLGVDAYDANSVRTRTINLTFKTQPQINGEFILNWSMSEVYYEAYLTYYGNDSNRSNNLSSRMNMETVFEYTDPDLVGRAYLLLEIYYYPPINPEPDLGGGGGGGGGGAPVNPLLIETCNETLICNNWNVCQNLEFSFKDAIIAETDYLNFKKECISKGYDTEICGFQTRDCSVVDQCVNSSLSPIKSQSCYYVINPSCEDNIKNCHGGNCEVLADCGGPCAPCPTCSDGIKNQGEKKIDCEGPCPNMCKRGISDYIMEIEGRQILSVVLYVLVIAVIVGAILFIIYYIKRIKKKVAVDQYSWYNLK